MIASRSLHNGMALSWTFRRAASTAAPVRKCNILVLGPPGGGKGTISKRLIRDFEFFHLSTGDILRDHVKRGTTLGKTAKKYMDAGQLVADELMVDLVQHELEEGAAKGKRILVDGFPRTIGQGEALEKVLTVDAALNLDVPYEEIVQRIQNRWTHLPSGRVYAYDYNPPKKLGFDDVTGEPLVQRDDDKPDTVRARLAMYDEQTTPLLKFYAERNVMKNFDGSNNPDLLKQDKRSDAIYEELKPAVEKVIEQVESN